MFRYLKPAAAIILLFAQVFTAQVRPRPATAAGVSVEHLALMDRIIDEAIQRKALPGAVVLVGHRGRIVWRKAYGARAIEPQREAMTTEPIFELARLTNTVATATSIMILV